jgi:hypothetical protein
MYKIQFKTCQLFFLLVFGVPALCKSQSIRKDSIDIKVLLDSLNKVLNNHYFFPDKAKSISIYLESRLNDDVYTSNGVKL